MPKADENIKIVGVLFIARKAFKTGISNGKLAAAITIMASTKNIINT